MDKANTRKSLEVFEELVDMDPQDREAELARLETADPARFQEVRRLLEADRSDRELFRIEEAFEAHQPGERLGAYRLERELGRGGMGIVFLGSRDDGAFQGHVALKLLAPHFATPDLVERFLLERNILAKLEHPGIARILDGGTDSGGLPYLAMEYVDGTPIAQYCDEQRLSVGERLRVFLKIVRAVSYAHRNLVVHRDLKPSNILVTAEAETKLLDFGIAKLLDGSDHTVRLGGSGLTPTYASPEQIQQQPVSTLSDIYSLGVVLYELLTGDLPFESGSDRRTATPRSMSRFVLNRWQDGSCERAARQRFLDERGATSLRGLSKRLRGDLEVIVAKALHPDPDRRYSSAPEFEEDLERYLANQPILARPDSLPYRARMFVRRNRLASAAMALALVSLIVGLGFSLLQTRQAIAQSARAEREAEKVDQINRFLLSVFEAADPSWYVDAEAKGPETRIIDILTEASERIGRELQDAPLEKADLLTTIGNSYRALKMHSQAKGHLQEALALRLEHQGEAHRDTVETLYYLASSSTDSKSAFDYAQRAVAAERQLAVPSSNAPYLLADTADDLIYGGLFDEAELRLERAEQLSRTQAAPTAQIQANQALLSLYRGDPEAALDLDTEPAVIGEAVQVTALVYLGRYEEAGRVVSRWTGIDLAGPLRLTAARAWALSGRLDVARPLLQELADQGQLGFFGGEFRLLEAYELGREGRNQECLAALDESLVLFKETIGSLAPLKTADVLWRRGECLAGLERNAEAVAALEEARDLLSGLFSQPTAFDGDGVQLLEELKRRQN